MCVTSQKVQVDTKKSGTERKLCVMHRVYEADN